MKLNKVLPMLAVATFALAACAPKVDFAKFQEKAKAAVKKESGYKKAVVKGTEKGDFFGASTELKFDHTFELDGKVWKLAKGDENLAAEAARGMLEERVTDAAVEEEKHCTYYAGSTFKVIYEDGDDKMEAQYDKFGYPTIQKGKMGGLEYDVKISWSK